MRIASELTGRLQLPVLPHLLERLILSRHDPLMDRLAASRCIKMDPGLCLMALRLDRAMAPQPPSTDQSGFDPMISRIGKAGINAIADQVLARQGMNSIRHRQALSLAWLWRHSLTTALLALALAQDLNYRPAEEAYIAGLLHDIGKWVLATRTPEACTPLLADPVKAHALFEAEEKVCQSDHSRIGAWLIRRHTHVWLAADAARYHTEPASRLTDALPLVQIVWAANRLTAEPQASSDAGQRAAQLLNMDPQRLDERLQEAVAQAGAAAQELGVTFQIPSDDQPSLQHPTPLTYKIQEHASLSSLYAELLTAADSDAILRALRRSLSLLLGVDSLILLTHEPPSNRLVGRLATGGTLPGPGERVHISLSAAKSLPVICCNSGKPVDSFTRTGQADLTIIDHQLMAYLAKDGIACWPAPLGANGHLGCLVLGVDSNEWAGVKRQADLLKAIVTAVCMALGREHRLHEQIRHQIADHSALNLAKTRKLVHEINNPLTIIKNCLKVLALRTDSHVAGMDGIRIIDEEISRVAGLLQSLARASEGIGGHLKTVDVNATITDILVLFRESLSEMAPIVLKQDLDNTIPAITGDPNLVKQVLINLLKNAVEAMPNGGTVTVSTRMMSALPRSGDCGDLHDHVSIRVCDDGPGMDERFQQRLYTPHLTSKVGHEGLGLTIVNETVQQLKGSLRCESTPGRGTCFIIELPVATWGPDPAAGKNFKN